MKKFLLTLFLVCGFAHADTVKLVVPFAPGGAADQTARVIERSLMTRTKHTYIIENRAGAGGAVGAMYVAKNKSNETVLLIHSLALVVNSLMPDAGFSLTDFTPVMRLGSLQLALATNPKSSVNTMDKLLKTTDPVFFGSSGIASATHLAGELFGQSTGRNMVHVPYKGEALALNDILGNNLMLLFTAVSVTQGQNVKVLAVSGLKRSAVYPDVPTFNELGIKTFDSSPNWLVLLANPTADPKIVAEVQSALAEAMKSPDEVEGFVRAGVDIERKTPYNTQQFMLVEQNKVRRLLEKVKVN